MPYPRLVYSLFLAGTKQLSSAALHHMAPLEEPLVLRHFSYIFDNLGSERLALLVSSTTKMSQVPKESLSAQIQALPW